MSVASVDRATVVRARTGVFVVFAASGFAFSSWASRLPDIKRILDLSPGQLGTLLAAIERAGLAVTDEASAIEAAGLHPRLVPGGAQNFKVTYPDDFALATAVLTLRMHSGTLERFGGARGVAVGDPRNNPFFS